MKFETKHLIRWGIPGWVFIFWLFYEMLFLKGINPLDTKMADLKTGLTLLISLTAIGVPIGYLLHQMYFGYVWVSNKNKNYVKIARKVGKKFPRPNGWGQNKNQDYFHFEYVWHQVLIKQNAETRAYLEARYRHLLGNIHGLGALFVSSLLSLLMSVAIIFTHLQTFPDNIFFWIGLVFQIAIYLSAVFNYGYYSDNLRAFQIKMLQTYL
ncbi:hypothetical protein CN692_14215 [Bacillus sp. AFS002410]|uniref:hypothetical protein n=1 Tax=Bacillus sp. AFS002410 TaxID=2033481 RepID=UPI000BF0324D|nr:hypothetical protein [Bacillus sp. AFS002410]PEJ57049.1 hypothetical protein CN692_14215 [Bacillus sp. AFS002410]